MIPRDVSDSFYSMSRADQNPDHLGASKAAWALLFLDTGGKALTAVGREDGSSGHVCSDRLRLDVTDRLSRRLHSSGKGRYDLGLPRNAHHVSHAEEQDPSHSAPGLTPPSEGTPYILGQDYDLFWAWNFSSLLPPEVSSHLQDKTEAPFGDGHH